MAFDEAAWSRVADHVEFTIETILPGGKSLGATDLAEKTTYVRGWALLHPFRDDLAAQPSGRAAHLWSARVDDDYRIIIDRRAKASSLLDRCQAGVFEHWVPSAAAACGCEVEGWVPAKRRCVEPN